MANTEDKLQPEHCILYTQLGDNLTKHSTQSKESLRACYFYYIIYVFLQNSNSSVEAKS